MNTENKLAERYLHHRKEADKAHRANDGAACTGHAMQADLALIEYAKDHGITTEEAASRIRRGRP